MITLIIIAIIIILIISAKIFLRKYEKPLYEFRGEYQYTYYGKCKEYYTETIQYPSNSKDKSIVFLFLSGNPGNVRFYDRFLYHLSEIYNKKYDFIGIGQAGQFNKKGQFKKYFNLDEQVDHKLEYYKDLISQEKYRNSKFVFIGHSFGCYTALKLMNQIDKNRIVHAVMIHPAIDRLVQTPNGKQRKSFHRFNIHVKILLRFTDWFVPLSLIRYLSVKTFEKDKYKEGEDINDCAETLAQWICYDNVISFLNLTRFQFDEIHHINEDEIQNISNKMTFYYAKSDDWTPDYMKQEFKEKYSDLVEYHEDEFGLDHTFVAGGSRVKAQIIQRLLTGKL